MGKIHPGDYTAPPRIEEIDNVRRYSHKELKDATSDFSPDNKVGQDAFGFVYKGTLKDGTVVAIKVIKDKPLRRIEEFFRELKAIHDIAHENLVRLYGWCIEGDHRMLIYDYFVIGDLAEALFGENRRNIQLSWRKRARICIGVARGLACLHEEVQPHIIHRDIKPANIVLDRDLTPKITSYELAKFLPDDESHTGADAAGTWGYVAPEYISTGQVRRSSDVYSFGLLLLEIVTGKRNLDMIFNEDQSLCERVWMHYKHGSLWTIIDAWLIDEAEDVKEAFKFLKIGLLCIQANFDRRPTMSTVVNMLEGESDVEFEPVTRWYFQ